MKGDNDKLLESPGGGAPEEGESLFSMFRPRPAPVPAPAPTAPAQQAPPPASSPAPMAAPVSLERPPARVPEDLDAKISAIEKRLEEAALRKPAPPAQDREMLEYLKSRVNEMEGTLRESQEKGLAFAYEVKGRDEARKESRREMEEFLAEVKRQQAESEAERSRGLELEKARARIEALELKILEFSKAKAEPPPPPQIPAEEMEKLKASLAEQQAAGFEALGSALAGKITTETLERQAAGFEALGSALTEKITTETLERQAACFEALGSDLAGKLAKETQEQIAAGCEAFGIGLTEKIAKETLEPLACRLDAESAAREQDKYDLRLLANNISDKASSLDASFSKKFAEMDALFAGFSSQLKGVMEAGDAAREASGKNISELRAAAGASFDRLSGLETSMASEFARLAASMEEFRSGLREVSAGIAAKRAETAGIVEGFKRVLEAGGASSANEAARRLVEASGPYDYGFITACFNNLEKAFASASDGLARSGDAVREAAELPAAQAVQAARRQAAIMDSAARDLAAALEVFRGIKQEALKPIKKVLGA